MSDEFDLKAKQIFKTLYTSPLAIGEQMIAQGLRQANAEGRAAERKACLEAVPTSWLDPLLTGPEAVVSLPLDGPAVERLLQAVARRIEQGSDK